MTEAVGRPRKLFLIDALGGVGTAIALAVLSQFHDFIGMPQGVLLALAVLGCFFASYSFFCFRFAGAAWRSYLWPLMIANLAYCVLTAGLVILNFETITGLGIFYFAVEVAIILGLVWIEGLIYRAPTH